MDNLSGQAIKGYELRERIGSGGFGAVYKAYQTTVGREVAIKIILPGFANKPDFIRRFEMEAQIIARLEHPFIVPLFDYWRDPNGAYLVMRWLRGGSLSDALKSGPFGLEAIARLLDQVTSALSVAHRNGVIHRDIKPGNILLDEDQNVYLADFGIAKDLLQLQEGVTQPDAVIGSLDYISPEQARGEPVTPRTDIYSLGVVIYELLQGEHPFPNSNPLERLYKHINDRLPDLVNGNQPITEALNDVIQQATAKNPLHRYADALELATAFRAATALDQLSVGENIVEQLTRREQEILRLVVAGSTNQQIANELFIELSTVKWYNNQLYKKLGVRSRMQAIVRARELNLVVDTEQWEQHAEDAALAVISLPEPENPYKGLRAFEAADHRDFFGREALVERVLERLNERHKLARFLTIAGPSGGGKSSLVKAGLIPALWRGDLPGSERWFVVEVLPGPHPLDKLEVALTRIAAEQSTNVHEHLARDERGLTRIADLILPDDGSELVIIIDQFEEVFTLVEDETERQHFLDLIRSAVTEPRSRVRVVVTLRADFYDRPLHYPEFGELVRSRMETVLPLSAKGLERAIAGPAERVGVTFEEGLIAQIVSEMTYQSGALPLLQYGLTELFERRQGRVLTQSAYQTIGGAVGALAQRAEDLYQELVPEAQEITRQMFMRLVTLGEGVEDTRRRVAQGELLAIANGQNAMMEDIIDMYAAYRLLTLDRDPATHTPTVEVAHEAVLREWERLRIWLDDSRSDIRMQRQMGRMAEEWATADREASFLLRGARLEMFEGWIAGTTLAITPQERDFLTVSVAERGRQVETERLRQLEKEKLERRARRVLQGLVAVFLIAAIVAGGLALFAFDQQATAKDERDKAEKSEQDALRQASIGLAAQAVAELDSDAPERGVLLALEALEHYPYTPQAERALAQTVYGTHQYINLRSTRNRVLCIALSPDGTRVAAAERSIEIWDSVSGERIAELNATNELQDITSVEWSTDGQFLVTSSSELQIARIWNVETGEEILRYEEHDGAVFKAYLSPDDRFVLTASSDGTAHIWAFETGETVHVFAGHEGGLTGAAWSPDGSQIVTVGDDGTIRRWNIDSGTEQMRIDAHLGGVNAVAWSSDGTRLASAGNDGLGRVWGAETGELLFTLIGHSAIVRDIEWSPDGTRLATVGGDGLARIWETVSGSELFSLSGGDADVISVSWSPDGQQLVVGGGVVSRIWDITSPIVRLVGHTAGDMLYIMTNLPYWSPDSRWVGTGAPGEHTYRLWDPVTGKNLTTFDGGPVGQAFVNPAGTEIFLVNPPHILDLETGEERSFMPPDGFGEDIGIGWSPDGNFFVIQNGVAPEYKIYDVETQNVLFSGNQRCAFNFPLSWSPDGQHLAQTCFSGEQKSVLVTEALTGEVVHELQGHTDAVIFADWSPDGTRLATASFDQTVRVWDFETGETLTVFTGHTAGVFDVDWSPNGTRLVSGDTAGNVLIWDAETGEEVNRYNVGGSIILLEWSPDGTRVLTTGVFDAPDIHPVWQTQETLIAYAYECCVTRDLTPEERAQFGLPPRNE